MKIILTITISFVYLCGYGQNNIWRDVDRSLLPKDNGFITVYDTSMYRGSGGALDSLSCQNWRFGYKPAEFDTIPVIMLVCDTTVRSYETTDHHTIVPSGDTFKINAFTAFDYKKEKHFYVDNNTYWVQGYSVREFEGYVNGNTGTYAVYIATPSYRHLLYLDDKKKPLPASIIVWQTINRK